MKFRRSYLFSMLALMVLPGALCAASRTWTGRGADTRWSTPQNWVGNTRPAAGDRLIFTGAAARLTAVNDYAISTPFHSLSVAGNYTLEGAEIAIEAGITVNVTAAPGAVLRLPLVLLARQTFALSNAIPQGIELSGKISLGAHAHIRLPRSSRECSER